MFIQRAYNNFEIEIEDAPSFINTYSMDFDGVDDYVSAGDILNNNSVGSEAFSMSCWFKTSASGGSYYLIGKAKNSSQVDGYHFFINSSGQIRFFLGRYTGTASTSPWIYVRTTTTWNDGNWHNVVLTYNGNQNTSGLSIYVDGNSQSLTSIYNNTPSINSTDSEFIIGARGKSGDIGGLFSGEIDEASYFNSELTSEDVTAIYNGGTPTDLTSLSPLVWYRMGDNGSYKSPQWLLPSNENKDKLSNYSFDFDGIDDDISFAAANSGPLYDIGTGDFTVSIWAAASSKSNYAALLGNWSVNGLLMWKTYPSNLFECYIGGNAFTTTYTIPLDDTWHHYVIKRSGTNVTIYVDGISVATGTSSATLASSAISYIGNQPHNARKWSGKIDEVSIFNSAVDIGDLWDGSGEPTTLPSGAVAHYKMGEEATFSGGVWTVPDQVGSNDGTSANMTIEDRVGEAPNSDNNALSYNMDEVDRVTDTP